MTSLLPEPFCLLAVDPSLGGACIYGAPETGLPWPLGELARLLTGRPPVRVPAGISPETLLDRIDVRATLAQGRPVRRPSPVVEARGRALVVEAGDVISPPAAAQLAALLDTEPLPGRALLLIRRSSPPSPADPLGRCCGLWIAWQRADELSVQHLAKPGDGQPSVDAGALAARVRAARELAARIELSPAEVQDICKAVEAAGGSAHPLDYFVARAARARAAWCGRRAVLPEDVEAAIGWVVTPRLSPVRPVPESPSGAPVPPAQRDAAPAWPAPSPAPLGTAPSQSGAHPTDTTPGAGPEESSVVPDRPAPAPPAAGAGNASGDGAAPRTEAASGTAVARRIVVPPAALPGAISLAADGLAPSLRTGKPSGGGAPAARAAARRGGHFAVTATLIAAIPFQRLRRPRPPLAVRVLPADLRWRRRKPRPKSLYILAVDGSGSMTAARMHTAKGAGLRILQDAYRDRRYVALIDFRDQAARLLCPPGRSSALLRRHIAGLPSGGGTPLPAALVLAGRLAHRWRLRHPDGRVTLVLFTDGKANVPLAAGRAAVASSAAGAAGQADLRRRQAQADAARLGATLRALAVRTVVVDTAPTGTGGTLHSLAGNLGAIIVRVAPKPPGFRRR